MVSALFVVFPCYNGADEKMMVRHTSGLQTACFLAMLVCLSCKVHDPTSACYSYTALMILTPIAICFYLTISAYVLGFSFWARKGQLLRQLHLWMTWHL